MFEDVIHIAKDMPISAAVNAGFQDYWLQFCRAWTKKKATEVAYRLPTNAPYLRFFGSATTIPNPLGWIQENSTPPPSIA